MMTIYVFIAFLQFGTNEQIVTVNQEFASQTLCEAVRKDMIENTNAVKYANCYRVGQYEPGIDNK